MNVKEIMSKRIVTIEMDDTLRVVRDIFSNVKFHHLLVVEHSRLYGILSDRDLLKALSPNLETAAETLKDRATLNKKVHQIMSREPITLPEKAGVRDAIRLFNTETITCIPIVDEENRPVGIISWRDIIKMLGKMVCQKSSNKTA
ncbi:CBS domain-containing protein [Desulfoluna sp.]|uniref:CBS domain-containing protein n=1 Tax=Desulfoluna sp. TaxID=2045199 RepID=UPI0026115687|nr:CBS domain-containing protein [Desulfoluna sp.]